MSPLHTPDDVVARLRDASAVPDVRFDTPAVLAAARRALRRRRRRQAFVSATAAGLLALTVSGPVHLPSGGTLAMPGGHQVRTWLGVEDTGEPAPAPAAGGGLGGLLDGLLDERRYGEPSPETMAEEVASLQTHVLPVLEELKPTWYEVDGRCDILEYPRGTFSTDGECGGRPAEQPFDDVARADFGQILDAVQRSGVPTNELLSATYAPDGTVESAGFYRFGGGIEWNLAYLYSPDDRPAQENSPLGPVTTTPIGHTGWWFEKSPND
jgi:hypothetical protein